MTPEGPQLISQMVRRNLGIDCCVLMGANIATVRGYRCVLGAEGRWVAVRRYRGMECCVLMGVNIATVRRGLQSG